MNYNIPNNDNKDQVCYVWSPFFYFIIIMITAKLSNEGWVQQLLDYDIIPVLSVKIVK
jgi:hypothetical protein